MKTMTWEEIDKDWGRVQRSCRDYVEQAEAEAITRYCVGHDMRDVARRLKISRRTIQRRLDLAGMGAAIGGGALSTPIQARQREADAIIKKYAPKETDSDAFEPYVEHYLNEGHTQDVANRLAKAEWAAEEAVEKGVIKEDHKKSGERINRILFPNDEADGWTLRFRSHMAAVARAAEFLDSAETKIGFLRRKSTLERVASVHEKWLEQVERVRNLHPNTLSKES